LLSKFDDFCNYLAAIRELDLSELVSVAQIDVIKQSNDTYSLGLRLQLEKHFLISLPYYYYIVDTRV
jgi:hypothetical protein